MIYGNVGFGFDILFDLLKTGTGFKLLSFELPIVALAGAEMDKSQPIIGASLMLIALVLAIAAGIFVYFIPTFIAKSRKHESFGWILFLNLFFGWTVLLWVALILWAGLGNKEEEN